MSARLGGISISHEIGDRTRARNASRGGHGWRSIHGGRGDLEATAATRTGVNTLLGSLFKQRGANIDPKIFQSLLYGPQMYPILRNTHS